MGKIIRKILIANRGEIAVRIIRTAKKLGIQVVAIYAEIDKHSLHVRLADESYSLGEIELADTYLNIEKIIAIALTCRADAIHPGYGFLSENPLFVEACQKAGLIFIGPGTHVMDIMGNKISSRKFVKDLGIPITEGLTGTREELLASAGKMQFPVLIKAAAGGGGKGMQIIYQSSDLNDALESTSRQAKSYFGDDTVYIEKYLEDPRHIEFQILGDSHGNVVHLYERECTIQRRYQKIIEESPSLFLTPELRKIMGEAAVRIGKETGYINAGTIEFLVDRNMDYHFLEMNTRIQVEHGVTEMVTGIDMVEQQIRIAEGKKLDFTQEDVHQKGHSIECRIYAEDPANNFRPSPGILTLYHPPQSENVRLDSGIDSATIIQSLYDPLIAKVIVWGTDRTGAIAKMEGALDDFIVHGISTNTGYLAELLKDPHYISNEITTHYCDDHTPAILESIRKEREEIPAKIILTALVLSVIITDHDEDNVWKMIGFWRNITELPVVLEDNAYLIGIKRKHQGKIELLIEGEVIEIEDPEFDNGKLTFRTGNNRNVFYISQKEENKSEISTGHHNFIFVRTWELPVDTGYVNTAAHSNEIFSPMPGKVISINVRAGDIAEKGTVLMIIEAMKMENQIIAPDEVRIKSVNVKKGDRIEPGIPLMDLEKIKSNENQIK